MRDVNLPANFVPIEGGKILRVFDYFNLPDELFELIPADMPADILRDMLVSLIKGFTLTCICRMGWNGMHMPAISARAYAKSQGMGTRQWGASTPSSGPGPPSP